MTRCGACGTLPSVGCPCALVARVFPSVGLAGRSPRVSVGAALVACPTAPRAVAVVNLVLPKPACFVLFVTNTRSHLSDSPFSRDGTIKSETPIEATVQDSANERQSPRSTSALRQSRGLIVFLLPRRTTSTQKCRRRGPMNQNSNFCCFVNQDVFADKTGRKFLPPNSPITLLMDPDLDRRALLRESGR